MLRPVRATYVQHCSSIVPSQQLRGCHAFIRCCMQAKADLELMGMVILLQSAQSLNLELSMLAAFL